MGMPGLVLMERAALSAAAVLMKNESRDTRFLAVSGAGNNGGDAVAVARILHEQGYQAAVTVAAEESKMSEDLRTQLALAANCSVPVLPLSSIEDGVFDVLIDGIFGIGLSREVTGAYRHVIECMNNSGARCYAVDIPSGIDAETGAVLGVAVRADVTVTFGVNKQGLVLHPGCEYAGKVYVMDIGFPKKSVARAVPSAFTYELSDLTHMPERYARSNKGSYGHVLVVAGSKEMSGACYLAAKAAYRSGAGLVRVVTPEENRQILLSALPEILFSDRDSLLDGIRWADAIVIGPGIGREEEAAEMVRTVVQKADVPVVIDGDAIYHVSRCADRLNGQFVLTPHVKEMTYLAGGSVEQLLGAMYEKTLETSQKWNCIVAHKDARTIVSDGNKVYINTSGNNGMATGGSGDVLAGLTGGLLAQHMEPMQAACLGVYVHGLAGDCMARKKSVYSLMASDLLDGIAEVLSGIRTDNEEAENDRDR